MATILATIILIGETNMALKNDEEEIISSIKKEIIKFETPLRKIEIPSFSQVYVKDESVNLTGTHKDRMAYEILKVYKNFLLRKENSEFNYDLPKMSLLSSGAAAIAIQTILKKHNLPNLKVLLDKETDNNILSYLKSLGCETYFCDFSGRELSGKDILTLTDNKEGIDITSCAAFEPSKVFYQSLVEEVFNSKFDFIFIPFGSGNLYESFINIAKEKILSNREKNKWMQNCNFIGAKINNQKSKANQLYSPFRPFSNYNKQWLSLFKLQGYCGFQSDVYTVNEESLLEAINIYKVNNIEASPEGCTGLALLLQFGKDIPKDKKILVINTGKIKTQSEIMDNFGNSV